MANVKVHDHCNKKEALLRKGVKTVHTNEVELLPPDLPHPSVKIFEAFITHVS